MTGSLRRDHKASSNDAAAAVTPSASADGDEARDAGTIAEVAEAGAAAEAVEAEAVAEVEAVAELETVAEVGGSDVADDSTGADADAGADADTDADADADAGTAADELEPTTDVQWAPAAPLRKGYGGSAVSFALAGLATSFFVGWAFPLALIGIALGIVAVRKPEESSRLGAWGIALGVLATIYSAGWLWWAGTQLHWFG
ncbi:hypothetical protein GCM10009860_08980 [Microbacterium mitrae]|uniref:DUF4190 domain-containing protein n=1 Tax=Microbacterium mitrae TaxID=664640 RepID=A0A5C8HT52_9MICO|nr:hypothetical protein [Microbacterium mitrae]TXK06243.1 hypothetical protein FVP60_04600 [Microbacterium mitrae]